MSIPIIIMLLVIIYFFIIPSFKTRIFSVKKLIIMPAIFMYMNYESVRKNFHIHSLTYWIIALGLIMGVVIGMLLRKNARIRSDKTKLLIELAGSFFSLWIFLIIFSVHFVIGYLQSVNPTYLLQPSIGEQIILFLLTCTSSMTIGANGMLFYKYMTMPHSDLQEV